MEYKLSAAIFLVHAYRRAKGQNRGTAQAILDARALYPDSSLADLYDVNSMPAALLKAHQNNDKAVWDAYGRAWPISSESQCVAHLMRLYQELTKPQEV